MQGFLLITYINVIVKILAPGLRIQHNFRIQTEKNWIISKWNQCSAHMRVISPATIFRLNDLICGRTKKIEKQVIWQSITQEQLGNSNNRRMLKIIIIIIKTNPKWSMWFEELSLPQSDLEQLDHQRTGSIAITGHVGDWKKQKPGKLTIFFLMRRKYVVKDKRTKKVLSGKCC